MDAEDSAPYLLHLLGMRDGTERLALLTPEAIRTRTFETLTQMSLKGSQQRPLLLAIEDLHWIDHTSQDYLASFVESLPGAPVLLLTTYRPGYQPSWLAKSYATQVALPHLPSHHAVTVIHATSHQHAVPPPLAQVILEKAQGNPFFLEELTRAVIEHEDTVAPLSVPDTIQGVLSARLDRLPEAHKRLLQTAAVLGREFAPRLVQALWEEPTPLAPLLLDLKRLEFLYERARGEEPVYVFKHALTQEVAYNSLLTTRRQGLHAAAGHALERLYPDGLTEHAEELAHHFPLGEVWDKAFVYLARSGDKARQAYANQEAIAFYTQALEVSRRITPALDDVHLLPIYEGRGLVWTLLTKYDEAIADFQHMRQLARAASNPHKEGESLSHLAFAHWGTFSEAHIPLVEQCALEAMQLFQQTGDQKTLARSLTSLASVDQIRGNLQEADRKLEESLQISRREGYQDSLALNMVWLGAHAHWQGHFQRAIAISQEGLAVACDIYDGVSELFALGFLCLDYWSVGAYAQALTMLRAGMMKAQARENRYIVGRLTNTLGWFHSELGDGAQALEHDQASIELGRTFCISNVEISALINVGLDYLALAQPAQASVYLEPTLERVQREAFGVHRWRWTIRLLTGLAEWSYTIGDHDQALRYVEEGLKEAQRTSSQKYLALGWALRGKIVAKLGDFETAGTELQRAFTLAEQLQSPSLLYPIAYDLGCWYETTGKEREAAALYGKAKATVAQMATAVEDDTLRSTFLQSALAQAIHERAARLGE
jgi:tetratricopeptide (TPR) repeat protein